MDHEARPENRHAFPFSGRVTGALPENRLHRALRQRQEAGLPVLDLTVSSPLGAGIPLEAEARDLLPWRDDLHRYRPDPQGLSAAREAVAAYYAARGIPTDPDDLHLVTGTSEAYSHLFKLLCEPGEEVLVPEPGYPLFPALARFEEVRTIPFRLEKKPLLRELELSLSRATRALLLVNPHNPLGTLLGRGEAAALADLSRRENLALLEDEVFIDFIHAPDAPADPVQAAQEAGSPITSALLDPASPGPGPRLLFTLNGLSKTLGLPQMKLGWIRLAGEPELKKEARERLRTLGDAFLSVSGPVQAQAALWLQNRDAFQKPIRRRLAENLAFLRTFFAASPLGDLLRPDRPEAGWYLVLRAPPGSILENRDDDRFCAGLLREMGVFLHPGYFFDFHRAFVLVLSLLTPPEILAEGLRALEGFALAEAQKRRP